MSRPSDSLQDADMASPRDIEKQKSSSKTTPLTTSALNAWDLEIALGHADASGTKKTMHTRDLQGPFYQSYHKPQEPKCIKNPLEAAVGEERAQQDASQPSMIAITEHIVDGIVFRSPETVGTLIEVRRSEGKGFGVFALKDIPTGSVLLSEAPLVKLIDNGARADPLDILVDGLSPSLRKAYRSLHSYRRKNSESLNRSILYSNGFAVGTVATGVFEIASRFNHSCVPNSEFAWDDEIGRMVYTNRFRLMEGEEVTIDYGHKKGHLKKFYGFECDCGGCTEWGSATSSSGVSGESKEDQEMPNIDALVLNQTASKTSRGVSAGSEERKENSKGEGERGSEKQSNI